MRHAPNGADMPMEQGVPIKPHKPDQDDAPKSTLKAAARAYRLKALLLQRLPPDVAAGLVQQELDAEARRDERERERQEHERRERDDPRFVVTMVHGTFAAKARWILPDEPLGRELRAAAPTWIEPFV